MYLHNEGLGVPEAHNLINPTLNTVGVQCGVPETIPMRVEDTPHHINQQGSVPPARRTRMSVPTPHGTSLRVGLIRLCAFSTSIGHYLFFLQFRLTNFDIRVKIFKRCTLFLQLLELRKGFLIPFTIILLYSFLVLQLH